MKYNYETIGKRVAKERKAIGYSQEDLCKYLNIGRNTLSKLEHGKGDVYLETIMKMCELFHCDVGYLLGDHDNRVYGSADIQELTGLSEKAATNLINCREESLWYEEKTNIFNCLFANPKFFELENQLEKCLVVHNKCKGMADKTEEDFIDYVTAKKFIEIFKKGAEYYSFNR